jgi:hypothetical protein
MVQNSTLAGERLVRQRIMRSLLVVTPLGFSPKLYAGPGRPWVNNSAVGVPYVVFWCLVFFFVRPRKRYAAPIASVVFAATCIVEALQLWHPLLLEPIRATFLGRTLLGTTFGWQDLFHYMLGAVLGWLWMRWISRCVRLRQ